jgi:hypothetical protein|nr:MAG TPA: hypothetical protein [Caudoviricetes sp.]
MEITKDNIDDVIFELCNRAALHLIYDDSQYAAKTSELCHDVAIYLNKIEKQEKDYTKKLDKVFQELRKDGILEKLETYCTDALIEITQFKQSSFRERNADRLLYFVSKLSLAIDLFAFSFSHKYARTLETMKSQRQNMLDDLVKDPFSPIQHPNMVGKE